MAKKRVLAKIEYNVKAHKDFYLFHLTHKSSFIYLMPILMLIMLLFMLNNNESSNLFTFIFFIIFCLLLMVGYLWLSVNMNVKRDYKARHNSIETIEISKDNIFRQEEKDGVVTGKDVIGWYQIFNIYEVKKYFFIYTSNEHGFMVPKDGLLEGSVEQIRDYCFKYLKPDNKGKVPFKQTRKIKREIKNGLSK